MKTNTAESGFMALTSVLIMCAILLLLMFSNGASSFYSRFDVLGSVDRRTSLALSESCANAALLKIAQNYTYTVVGDSAYVAGLGVRVTVGSDECLIQNVVFGAEDAITHRKIATITARARYPVSNGSWSTTRVSASVLNPAVTHISPAVPPMVVLSWEQI